MEPSLAEAQRIFEEDVLRGGSPVEGESLLEATKTILSRAASTSCAPGDNSGFCEKPQSASNLTLPIALGAGIPIVCAIFVLIYLHRRNKKRQRIEDVNDPHKSLDFGMEFSPQGKKGGRKGRKGRRGAGYDDDKHGNPELSVFDMGSNPIRPGRGRGLSMDMLGSPYVLPPGLHGSHESIHSMTRSMRDQHDPYRPVTLWKDNESLKQNPFSRADSASARSISTYATHPNEKAVLLSNAQRPGFRSSPPASNAAFEDSPLRAVHSARHSPNSSEVVNDTPAPGPRESDLPLSNHASPPLPPLPAAEPVFVSEQPQIQEPVPAHHFDDHNGNSAYPQRMQSMRSAAAHAMDAYHDRHQSEGSYYGDEIPPPPPPPPHTQDSRPSLLYDPPTIHEDLVGQYEVHSDMHMPYEYPADFAVEPPMPPQHEEHMSVPMQDKRLSVMGLRPLPPDNPEENAEQRANRIRSFYKEYFDDSRPNPVNAQYEEPYDMYPTEDYAFEGAIYDPETGAFFTTGASRPFAQPPGRRAMTPPPTGSRFAGGPPMMYDRHFSSMSGGMYAPRMRGQGFRTPPPKKRLPPPKALKSLPTPHMLAKDDSLMNAVDFAPRTTFREMQNGRRADSPLGVPRPYSPSIRAFSPLSSRSDLGALPSPHHLRKSGTFTSLDFTPVPRFRPQGTASDAGSIRSARSGMSALQLDAARSGAYRISRIPKNVVGTQDDMAISLKPSMNMIQRA